MAWFYLTWRSSTYHGVVLPIIAWFYHIKAWFYLSCRSSTYHGVFIPIMPWSTGLNCVFFLHAMICDTVLSAMIWFFWASYFTIYALYTILLFDKILFPVSVVKLCWYLDFNHFIVLARGREKYIYIYPKAIGNLWITVSLVTFNILALEKLFLYIPFNDN